MSNVEIRLEYERWLMFRKALNEAKRALKSGSLDELENILGRYLMSVANEPLKSDEYMQKAMAEAYKIGIDRTRIMTFAGHHLLATSLALPINQGSTDSGHMVFIIHDSTKSAMRTVVYAGFAF